MLRKTPVALVLLAARGPTPRRAEAQSPALPAAPAAAASAPGSTVQRALHHDF